MKIEVDYSYLNKSAAVIDGYVNSIIVYMKASTRETYCLTKQSWKSSDGKFFYKKWLEQTDKDSVTEHVKANLRDYANSLRFAQKKYKKAQSNAYNDVFKAEVGPL